MKLTQAHSNILRAGLMVVLLLTACGKNGPNAPYGPGQYYPVAPAPQGSLPYYPNGGYPGGYPGGYNGGYPYGSPYGYNAGGTPYYFNPQLPAGYPQNYYPFLPLDNYFRNNPYYGQQYWNGLWNHWTQQAYRWGVSPYDFVVFWNDYCPYVWNTGNEQSIYVYFGQTFYHWAQPTTVLPAMVDPNQFWTHYIGVIY